MGEVERIRIALAAFDHGAAVAWDVARHVARSRMDRAELIEWMDETADRAMRRHRENMETADA